MEWPAEYGLGQGPLGNCQFNVHISSVTSLVRAKHVAVADVAGHGNDRACACRVDNSPYPHLVVEAKHSSR